MATITSNGLAPPTTDHFCNFFRTHLTALTLPTFLKSICTDNHICYSTTWRCVVSSRDITSLTNLITPTSRRKIHVSRSFILKVDSARGSDCSICLPNCMVSHRTLDSTCAVHVCWVSYYFWSIYNMIPVLSQCKVKTFHKSEILS